MLATLDAPVPLELWISIFYSYKVCYKAVTAPERPQIITDTSQIPAEDEKEGCPRCSGKVRVFDFVRIEKFKFNIFRCSKPRKCRPKMDIITKNALLVAIAKELWTTNSAPRGQTVTFIVNCVTLTCSDTKLSLI